MKKICIGKNRDTKDAEKMEEWQEYSIEGIHWLNTNVGWSVHDNNNNLYISRWQANLSLDHGRGESLKKISEIVY